jgi:hypothetical protein
MMSYQTAIAQHRAGSAMPPRRKRSAPKYQVPTRRDGAAKSLAFLTNSATLTACTNLFFNAPTIEEAAAGDLQLQKAHML